MGPDNTLIIEANGVVERLYQENFETIVFDHILDEAWERLPVLRYSQLDGSPANAVLYRISKWQTCAPEPG